MTIVHEVTPTETTPEEVLAELADLLADRERALMLDDGKGRRVPLPPEVAEVFSHVIAAFRDREPTVLYPANAMLTTQQAASFLGVSRPYLIRLLEEGKIPYSKTGTHRRVQFSDASAYREVMKAAQLAGITEMIRISEEAGLYDLP
jgi:excisionase family DNA binding protein